MKTSELSGAALDWAVAKCEGVEVQYDRMNKWFETQDLNYAEPNDPHVFAPTTYWEQGGPIIEREGIALDCIRWDGKVDGWIATLPMFSEAKYEEPSPTPLIAAMRCYVASKLGNEVEIPEELK